MNMLLLRREPNRHIQPDHCAGEHLVGDDALHQLGVFSRRAQAAGEGHARSPCVLHFLSPLLRAQHRSCRARCSA